MRIDSATPLQFRQPVSTTARNTAAPRHDRFEPGASPGLPRRPEFTRAHVNKYQQFSQSGKATAVQTAGVAGFQGALAAQSLHYPDGRWNIKALAEKALRERGLATSTPADVQAQVRAISGPAKVPADATWAVDMRSKPWSSIDNPTSEDLDQLACCEPLPNGDIKMYVAVTNVRSLVPKDSPLDRFMDVNTTSIYTADEIFPLMPDRLSCDLISLNKGQDRFANIIEYTVRPDGSTTDEKCTQGLVNNHAKLNYPDINRWIAGGAPDGAALQGLDSQAEPEMYAQLRLQNEASQRLQGYREARGALDFEGTEARVKCDAKGSPVGWEAHESGPANQIVENQMVTANQVMSRFLRSKGYPTLERVVDQPEKWDKIVDYAADHGFTLPVRPDGTALAEFLRQQKEAYPDKFADVSSQVVRLIGRGKYVHVPPGENPPGHFGMAIDNYVQSTAQMRRRGDQLNGDIFEAALRGLPCPYSAAQLDEMAENLTTKEEASKQAERQAGRSAMAVLLSDHLGERYDATVSGNRGGEVYVRVKSPPFEGHLAGAHNGEIGRHQRVRLDSVDVERGFIELKKA